MNTSMTSAVNPPTLTTILPDHTHLPESDGTFVKNFQEHPQSILLTDSIEPILEQRHPDGQYCIGQDCGIYWRLTDPPERGAEAPDWFYVLNVCLVAGQYQLLATNERGHYPISLLGVELGIWQGRYQNSELPWLRWWDEQGNLLLTGHEQAELERQRAGTSKSTAVGGTVASSRD
jgi:hypothetical protein